MEPTRTAAQISNAFAKPAPQALREPIEPEEQEDRLTPLTEWKEFVKARLVPIQIICQEYRPMHSSVTACHTRLLTKRAAPDAPINPKTKRPTQTGSAVAMLDHVRADHGGGFLVKFKRAEVGSPPWAGWAELRASGVEVVDIRCAWCEKGEDRVHAASLLTHFKPHRGAHRGLKASDEFLMTLAFPVREVVEGEDED